MSTLLGVAGCGGIRKSHSDAAIDAPTGPDAPSPLPGTIPTPANLTIAFIGDTASQAGFESVLNLIAAEGAAAVVHNGDAMYESETSQDFWGVVDRVLGHDYPYFVAQGNHDVWQWDLGFADHALAHAAANADQIDTTDYSDPKMHVIFRGLSMVFIGEDDREPYQKYAAYVWDRLQPDRHIWKICNWHKNQHAMQVGEKPDEMGWGVYETCRHLGAVIETSHEHSYHRTRTLTDTINQTVDSRCGGANNLCVGPGRTFVTVSGLGGQGMIRQQKRCLPTIFPYGCNGEWAYIYSADQGAVAPSGFGAQFIVFHEGGNPRKARGYFKTVAGAILDEFEIVAD